MMPSNRKERSRPSPAQSWKPDARLVWGESDAPWPSFAAFLERVEPGALGMLLPWATQLHRRAYVEARRKNIVSAFSMVTNVQILTGLMDEIPVEAIIATEEAARALEADLEVMGKQTRIRGWFIILPASSEPTFFAKSGETVHEKMA